MPPQTANQTITYLNSRRHRMCDDNIPNLFDNAPANTAEYWHASDLYNIGATTVLNTPNSTRTNFYQVIDPSELKKILNRDTPISFWEFISHHAQPIRRTYCLTNTPVPRHITNGDDTRLSRLACFLFTSACPNIDATVPAYFACPDQNINAIANTAAAIRRTRARAATKNAEHIMCGILYHTGKTPIGVAYNKIHNVLMNGYSAEALKHIHGIPATSRAPITDYMQTCVLNARNAAIFNAIKKMDTAPTKSSSLFISLLCTEMYRARHYIIDTTGRTPEEHITTIGIKQLTSALQKQRTALIRQYADITLCR